jgi:hypothetical protein
MELIARPLPPHGAASPSARCYSAVSRCFSFAQGATERGFLPRRSGPSLLISCKNSKNNGGSL